MASEAQSDMLGLLPPGLAELAVDLSLIAGSREYSFPLAVAPAVLETLLGNGVTVLGGDVWDFENDEYYPSGESWYIDSLKGESAMAREARVKTTASEFFARYATAANKRVTFVVKSKSATS
jgi:hypothetical protein